MICLVSFLHFAATGKALECENCQKRDNCAEKAEETGGRTMSDYISRQYLLDEYDRQHKGPPGGGSQNHGRGTGRGCCASDKMPGLQKSRRGRWFLHRTRLAVPAGA